jgi:hypothetical protein
MSTLQIFITVDTFILLIAAKLIFKNFKSFGKSLYWFLYPNIVSILTKKWDKDFENSFKMEVFIVVIFLIGLLNFLIFKFIL